MDVSVNGKRVTLRDRLTAAEGWPLRSLVAKATRDGDLSFEEEAQAIATVVESWEFPGDPHDPAAYAALDFSDFLALDAEAGKQMRTLILPASKN